MQAAIEVSGLGKSFGGQSVLDRASTSRVAPGEVFALLGPNGAGKTTTINILTTLVRPDAGRATVAGIRRRPRPRAGASSGSASPASRRRSTTCSPAPRTS